MGIFAALFGKKPGGLAPGRGWTRDVVGEASYQAEIESQYRKQGGNGHDLKVEATLIADEKNLHDANAVRVEIGRCLVGFLPRQAAVEYRAALGTEPGRCSAKIVGGFELEDGTVAHYGIKLNMAWPPRFAS